MPEPHLYQKISVISVKLYLLTIVCFFSACQKNLPSASPAEIVRRPLPSEGKRGEFITEDRGTHLLLIGFRDPASGTNVSLLFDTGSEISFLDADLFSSSRELIWENQKYPFELKKGILPEGIKGILGLEFFKHTCIWWEGKSISVYEMTSSVCVHPQAYFSTSLKQLVTKKEDSFYFTRFGREKGNSFWGLLDTGASISLLPHSFEKNATVEGKRWVFLPGGHIEEADLYTSKAPIRFETKQGSDLSYINFPFLRGISLEHLDLPKDKDREAFWVIGLDILRRAPLFWDFDRNRIGLF